MAEGAISFASVVRTGEDPFDLEGDLLDGQFRVVKIVGEGELSVVYSGVHEGVAAPIAIKCLNLPETLDPSLVAPISSSFREGARLHYRLAQGHLHIVQTLACGETIAPRTGQSVPYLVREWLGGRSLAADLAQRARAKQTRSAAEAIALLDSAADAVAYAHGEKVVHGSLSPKNLFVAKVRGEQIVKVLDFGLARQMRLATPGLSLLWPSYAAPEQLQRSVGPTSAATDVFAFATILLETLSGRPRVAPNAHVSEVLRIVTARERIVRTPGVDIPRTLAAVLERAFSPSPDARHPDMRAFWADVKDAAVSGTFAVRPSRKPTPPPVPRAPPPIRVVERKLVSEAKVIVAQPAVVVAEAPPPPPPRLSVAPSPAPAPEPVADVPRVSFTTMSISRGRVVAAALGAVSAIALLGGLLVRTASSEPTPGPRARRLAAHVPTALAAADVKNALRPPPPPAAPEPEPVATLDEMVAAAALAPRPWDPALMTRALDLIAKDLVQCTAPAAPHGPGSVSLQVHPGGWILWVQIGPPYAGTASGTCMANRFRATRLPPFVAATPRPVYYTFNTIPY